MAPSITARTATTLHATGQISTFMITQQIRSLACYGAVVYATLWCCRAISLSHLSAIESLYHSKGHWSHIYLIQKYTEMARNVLKPKTLISLNYVSFIGSGNGSGNTPSPLLEWTNADLFPNGLTRTHFSETWIRIPKYPSYPSSSMFTHWRRDEMAVIFQTTFSNAFSEWKYINFDWDFAEVCS